MNETLGEIERIFMAFGEKTRLRLLHLMRDGEVTVNHLCEALRVSQPKVSRHLAYLRSMGIVHTRRDGKWIFYSINEPKSRIGSQILRDMLAWVGSTPEIGGSPFSAFGKPKQARETVARELGASNTYVNANISMREDELEIHLL